MFSNITPTQVPQDDTLLVEELAISPKTVLQETSKGRPAWAGAAPKYSVPAYQNDYLLD